jgi:N-methylhydantoinase A/oxoprolinase/acetone carboxylase beta subunit
VDGDVASARRGERECLTAEGRSSLPVYDRDLLRPGYAFAGPALVDSPTTTVLVPSGFDAEMDEHLNLVLRLRSASRTDPAGRAARVAG